MLEKHLAVGLIENAPSVLPCKALPIYVDIALLDKRPYHGLTSTTTLVPRVGLQQYQSLTYRRCQG